MQNKHPSAKNIFESKNNGQNELNRMKDEIENLRKILYKQSIEYTKLKTEQIRNEEELKKNMKILEEIIASSNKSDAFLISRILYDKQYNNEKIEKLNLTKHNLEKLKEIYIVNILKTKNKEITKQISTKEQQIDILKNTSKVTSISKLENTLIINNNELNDLKQKFTILRIKYLNSEERFKEINEEHINLKNKYNELKNNYQQAKIDNLTIIKKHFSYKEKDKKQKEKLSRVSKSNVSMNSSYMNGNNNQSLNQTKNDITIDEKELEKLNNQIEELKKLNEIYQSQLNEKEKEYQGKNNQYNKLKDKFLNLQKAYKKEIEEKNANRNKKEELEKTKTDMSNKEKENKELEKEIEKLNKDIGDEQIKQFTFESEIDKQKLMNLEFKEKINNEQQILLENETKTDEMKDKIESLKNEIEKLKNDESPKDNFFSNGLGMNLLE